MTILKLLNGENVNFLQVNVLKEINSTQFIVGDRTGMAIMIIASNDSKSIEIGKGLKMVKPSKVEKDVITSHPKFSPMKTKAFPMDVDNEKMEELETKGVKKSQANRGINFNLIETDYGDNAVIDNVLAYVASASRIIEGKYGPYQICNIIDYEGGSLAINLYKSNINKLEVNQIYKLEKIKKTTIKTDSKLRMATTNFTKIVEATQNDIDLFADVEIADNKIEGVCIMFNDLNYYKTCKKHMNKLEDDGCCSQCGQTEKDDGRVDFRCSMLIENSDDDSMIAITIFKRHLKIDLSESDDETKLIELLEDTVVGKQCQIHYNRVGDENNLAVKVTIT